MAATFSATGCLPTRQPFAGAFPEATAAANPSQPGNPHAPQFAPGSTARIFTVFGSTFISKIFWKIPSRIPKTKEMTNEKTIVVIKIFIKISKMCNCVLNLPKVRLAEFVSSSFHRLIKINS